MAVYKRKRGEKGGSGKPKLTWCVDYYDPTGARVRKAIGKQKDAIAYEGKMRASIREGRYFDVKKDNKVTFSQLLDEYIKKMKGTKYFETSIQYFTGDGDKREGVLREHFGKMLLSEITYKALEDFRDKRKVTETQYGRSRSDRTVDLEMGILRHLFNRGVKWGMLEKNPFDRAADLFYRERSSRERALSVTEIKNLIEACPKFLKPIVITAIYTGLRKGDVLNLTWKDIDLEKGMVVLREAKTGKSRIIILNQDMLTLLNSLPVKGEYLFPNKEGKAYQDVKRSFEKAVKGAGIKQSDDRKQKVVFHTLRHTCISLLTERGADTTMVKNYVAHASEEMTRRYTHLSEEYARKTANILDGVCKVAEIYGHKIDTSGTNEEKTGVENLVST